MCSLFHIVRFRVSPFVSNSVNLFLVILQCHCGRVVCCVVDFPVKTYNAALKRPAFISSVHRNGFARLANDGSRATKYLKRRNVPQCAHSRAETNPWWAVDLGRPVVVYRVDFTNRGDSWGMMK